MGSPLEVLFAQVYRCHVENIALSATGVKTNFFFRYVDIGAEALDTLNHAVHFDVLGYFNVGISAVDVFHPSAEGSIISLK